jgi:hypothetical protein
MGPIDNLSKRQRGERVIMTRERWTWIGFISFSFIITSLFGLLTPYHFYDSQKYLLAASAIFDGSFRLQDVLVENGIGYPALIAATMWGAGILDLEFTRSLTAVQILMCVGIDVAVLIIATRLTKEPKIYIPAALFSVFSIETKLYAATVMTEITYLSVIVTATSLFLMALSKRSLPLAGVAATLAALGGFIRPPGSYVALIFWFIWCMREIWGISWYRPRTIEPSDMPHQCETKTGRLNIRSMAVRTVVTLAFTLTLISTVSSWGKDSEIGFRERLSLLWINTIQINEEFYQYFTEAEPFSQYRNDYFAWVESKQIPPLVSLEPTWTPKPHWEFLDRKTGAAGDGLRWWKTPQWVLMTQRGFSKPQALAWQGTICLNLILSHPGTFLKQVVQNIAATLYRQQPSGGLALSEMKLEKPGTLTTATLRMLALINEYHELLSPPVAPTVLSAPGAWVTLPMFWWTLLLSVGMITGFTIYDKWMYAVIILVVVFHLVSNPLFSFPVPRYRLSLEIFSGVFTMGWCWPLLNLFRKEYRIG